MSICPNKSPKVIAAGISLILAMHAFIVLLTLLLMRKYITEDIQNIGKPHSLPICSFLTSKMTSIYIVSEFFFNEQADKILAIGTSFGDTLSLVSIDVINKTNRSKAILRQASTYTTSSWWMQTPPSLTTRASS